MSNLRIEQSFSRPRVSNDNPFSESQFKPNKFWPSYPRRFRDERHAREWCSIFLAGYNGRRDEELALFPPADVYTGRVDGVWQIRQAAMDRHYDDHPERYVNGPPVLHRPPARVCINPDDGQPAEQVLACTKSFQTVPIPLSLGLPEIVA